MKMFYRSIHLYSTVAAAAFLLSVSQARAQVIDGTLDGVYGSALAVNVNPTGFGDSSYSAGPNFPDANGSELDAAYGVISGGNLNIFVSGNFENNGNKVDVFISDGRAGQSTLNAQPTASLGQNMDGSKFSPGFLATYALTIGDFQGTAFVEEYDLIANTGGFVGSFSLGPNGGIGSGNPGGGSVITYGINNSNTGGVTGSSGSTAASLAVNTGLELAIPLSLLGNPTGSINVLADINSGNNGFLANQFLPGLPSGTGNVGAGGPYSGAGSGQFDFSGTPGEFFTVVPEPSTIGLVVVGLLGALTIRRRKV